MSLIISKYEKLRAKIGKQTVYLLNDFRDVVIKIVPSENYWYAKPKSGNEYRLHHSTDLARETPLEANEITEKEYNRYS